MMSHGCRILERNYRMKYGEIDIIAEDYGTIVFVEVKTRRSISYGTPAQAVNYRKQNKIIQMAQIYLRQRRIENRPCRFDVIEVYAVRGDWQVHHIKGAFEA